MRSVDCEGSDLFLPESNGTAAYPKNMRRDLENSVEDLDIPVRASNRFGKLGIKTVKHLVSRSRGDLLAIDGIGKGTVYELERELARFGLALSATNATSRPFDPEALFLRMTGC